MEKQRHQDFTWMISYAVDGLKAADQQDTGKCRAGMPLPACDMGPHGGRRKTAWEAREEPEYRDP